MCVAWGPLASANGFRWTRGVRVMRHGRGQFVLTDDFQSPETVRHYRRFLGRPDEIRYQFTGRSVVLERVTDNTVDVSVSEVGAAR